MHHSKAYPQDYDQVEVLKQNYRKLAAYTK